MNMCESIFNSVYLIVCVNLYGSNQWWRNLFQSGGTSARQKIYGIFFSLSDLL